MKTIADPAREVRMGAAQEHHARPVEALKQLRALRVATPRKHKHAMRGDFREYWQEAVRSEIENRTRHTVFVWVGKPPGKHRIDSNPAWEAKTNDQGRIGEFEARLVARGFRQAHGIDYADTMAPVGKLTSVRMPLAEGARRGTGVSSVDIRSAYPKADLKIKQVVTPPDGRRGSDAGHGGAAGQRAVWARAERQAVE